MVTREMLPILLGWSITIHKSQGITVQKAIINLGKNEFSSGLTYTGMSRPTGLANLAFDPFPDYQRISSCFGKKVFKELQVEIKRKRKLEEETLDKFHQHQAESPSSVGSTMMADSDEGQSEAGEAFADSGGGSFLSSDEEMSS